MFRHLAIAAVAALGLGGCVSDYAYRDGGGVGDYYYGRPSVQYSDYGYGAPYGSLYGYPGGYGGYGGGLSLGYGYGGYGYGGGYGSPYGYGNGGYGGYYPYYPPYYWRGNHGHGNDDGNGNDHDNTPRRVTGGRLPPSLYQGGSASRSQIMSGGGGRSRVGGQPMRPPGSGLVPGRGSAPIGGPTMSRPPMSRPSGPSMRPQPMRSGGPAMSRPSPRMSAPVSRPIQRAAPVMRSPSSVRSRAPASRISDHVREVEP